MHTPRTTAAILLLLATGPGAWASPKLAVGQGPDPAADSRASVYNASPAGTVFSIAPYAATYGANVAFGEIDGDGVDELLTGPGPGISLGPHVRGWSETGAPMGRIAFYAYPTLNYGVNVSGNDLLATSSGLRDEIVTGAGNGPMFAPHVRGFTFDGQRVTAMPNVSFFAWSGLRYGSNVGDGDFDADGYDEILTTPGDTAMYGEIRAFTVKGGRVQRLFSMGAGSPVNAAAAELDGDPRAELLTAPSYGQVYGPHVRGWDDSGAPLAAINFYPFNCTTCGAKPTGGNLDGDAYDEILVSPWGGPNIGAIPVVIGFNYDGTLLQSIASLNFMAFTTGSYGANPVVSDTGW